MDINTQRFLFGSSSGSGGPRWINITWFSPLNGSVSQFNTEGYPAIQDNGNIIVAFNEDRTNGSNWITTLLWDSDGNSSSSGKVTTTDVSGTVGAAGWIAKGSFATPDASNTVWTAGDVPQLSNRSPFCGPLDEALGYEFDNTYLTGYAYGADAVFCRDVALAVSGSSTQAGAFLGCAGAGYPFGVYLNFGSSGGSPTPLFSAARLSDFTTLQSGPMAFYETNIKTQSQSVPIDFFVAPYSRYNGTTYAGYWPYLQASPFTGVTICQPYMLDGYGADTYYPNVIEQQNTGTSNILWAIAQANENQSNIPSIKWAKYNLETQFAEYYFGIRPDTASANVGCDGRRLSGVIDKEDENIAIISFTVYDSDFGVSLNKYMVLARVNLTTAEIIWSKVVTPYDGNTGVTAASDVYGTKLKYNNFDDLVISAGTIMPGSTFCSAFCLTFSPLTGPVNGNYNASGIAYRIEDYALRPTVGDVISMGNISSLNTNFGGTNLSFVSSAGFPSAVSQTFDF